MTLRRSSLRGAVTLVVVAAGSLAIATVVVGLLEAEFGVPNASAVYVVAVVVTAIVSGAAGAVPAAVASFLLYNFLFIDPRHTFVVADPGEWLNLVLMLFVAVVVGQLAVVQRRQADTARDREREALAQFRISRALATRESTIAALEVVGDIIGREAGMKRVWISLGPDDAQERLAADTGAESLPQSSIHAVLQRMPGDAPARWQRVHGSGRRATASEHGGLLFRVRIQAGETVYGSVWALRDRAAGAPDRTQTRLLSAAADQIAQVVAHDRLAADAQAAEIARQSDALKSALLQSVSHDLRTPLATIRAAAGTLRPGVPLGEDDRHESADAIDREVEYLDRLVTNLLDLSRIEAGALRAERDAFELADLVGRTLERLASRLADRPVEIDLETPPVQVDPVFLDEAVTNALENAVKHTRSGTPIRVSASGPDRDGMIRLTIEDAGAGVPDDVLPLIFDKFYRGPGGPTGSRSGTGIGLAVVRGLVEAMGGRVAARRADLGGLAIDLLLPAARVPADTAGGDSR